MIISKLKRYSINRIKSRIKSKKSKRKSKKIKRYFGNKENILNLIKNDSLFNIVSRFIKPKKVLKIITYIKKLTMRTLDNIKPDDSKVKLTCFQKLVSFFIEKIYKPRIDNIIKDIKPAQIIKILEGKMTNDIKNKIIWGGNLPEVNEKEITGIKDRFKLLFMKSIMGKVVIEPFKKFIKNLTPKQLILLYRGKFDISKAFYKSFITTNIPKNDEIDKEIKEVI